MAHRMFRFFALIPAAGRGTRMDAAYPKQYIQLAGKPMLYYSVSALAKIEEIERVFVVLAKDDLRWKEIDLNAHARKVVPLYCGGIERRDSVLNGLRLATEINDEDYILVHDAVRPCVTSDEVRALMREAGHDGALLAVPVADTLKREESGRVEATVDRQRLWRAQTPQMFRYGTLLRALELAREATDEAQAVEALGLQPKLVRGNARNLKVTLSEDLKIAEMILADRNG
jgi:2-C-methyl-D-erythritol 4-phosphate cytidylyltransferase